MLRRQEEFSSRFGLLAAAVGSAVGLGNLWRFPNLVGEYGGGAFLIVYIIMIFLLCIPLMIAEFIIGRHGRGNPVSSFKTLDPEGKSYISGIIGVIASFIILSFYIVITGWAISYVIKIFFNQIGKATPNELVNIFQGLKASTTEPIIMSLIVLGLTALVVKSGVREGIESKAKFFVPIFTIIMIIFGIRMLMFPGAMDGLAFLFKPDFSKLGGKGILAALGHAFFSLNLGLGLMITFGCYTPGRDDVVKTSIQVSLLDTILSLIFSIGIFAAAFAFEIDPSVTATKGPGLLFESMPAAFTSMKGGYAFSLIFFIGVILISFTSLIAVMENIVAYVEYKTTSSRGKAVLITIVPTAILGIILSLSNGKLSGISIMGKNLFELAQGLSANILLPIAALITAIFVGWKLDDEIIFNQITNYTEWKRDGFIKFFNIAIKYIVPIGIVIAFISGLVLK